MGLVLHGAGDAGYCRSGSNSGQRVLASFSKIEAWYDLEVDKQEADESTAKALTGQQKALYDNVCMLATNQLKGNVVQPVKDFLGENGNCRF